MNKKIKKSVCMLLIGVILALGLCGCCCDDAIVLSPEEEAQWQERQNDLFKEVVISEFSAQTLDGRTVDFEDCFAGNKITMVNIWGTFCSSCIEEMPEIVATYNELPEGTGLITICTDAGDSAKKTKFATKVMDNVGAAFLTIIPDDSLKSALTNRVDCFPTTIFVDETGKIIGTPHMGDCNKEAYLNAIKERVQVVEQQTKGDT